MNKSINDRYMNENEREQYSFGPWLVLVDNKELIPPQYRTYEKMILEADFCIKIPVNKDRKDVIAGTLMYKELVLFNPSMVTILKFKDSFVAKEEVYIRDITYVTRGGELLHNYITIGTKLKTYTVKYYSVSYEINSRIIKYIRDYFQLSTNEKTPIGIAGNYNNYDLYKFFQKSNRQNELFNVVGYQKEAQIPYYNNKGFGRIGNLFKHSKIDEVMFLASSHELVIISGDIDKARKASVDYSYRHIYIKLSEIKRIRLEEDDSNENIYKLNIFFDKTKIVLNVEENFIYKYIVELVSRLH